MAELSVGTLDARSDARRLSAFALLDELKQDVPEGEVTFGWLSNYLKARSPEVLILLLAIIGLLPGIALAVGALLPLLAMTMVSGTAHPDLPAFVARQTISSQRLVRAIERAQPLFRWSEKYVRAREPMLIESLRPFMGIIVIVLSATMFVPLPFSNVIPALAVGLIAFARIEQDGLLLAVSAMTALASFGISLATAWAMVAAAGRLWS